mgnify:FL=1
MRKNIICISRSISFVTGSFLFFLRVTSPAVLLFALFMTIALYATSVLLLPVAIVSCLIAVFFALYLQSIVFSLWKVKEQGYAVEAQRFRTVCRVSLNGMKRVVNVKKWFSACKYYFKHFKQMASLFVSCAFLFGCVILVVCLPLLAVCVIKYSISQSYALGDAVNIPQSLTITFLITIFFVNCIVAVILLPSLLPYKLRKIECDKEDAELEDIKIN